MKVVTLTLSPAFDIHCKADKLIPEHENLATVISCDAGGKGVNISRALSNFGIESTALIILGEENGDSFTRMPLGEKITLLPLTVGGRIRENITVHTANGKETRISFRDSFVSSDILDRVSSMLFDICSADTILTVSGRVPDCINLSLLKALITKLSDRGVKVIIDSRSFTLEDITEVKPFMIKPNEEEIEAYVGGSVKGYSEAKTAAERLHSLGIDNVMISLGGEGAVIATRGGTYYEKAPKITPISTIGAGDSAIAGFIMGMLLGESTDKALKRAVAFGSAACLTEGTNPPKVEDVELFL